MWKCRCKCGEVIYVTTLSLRTGNTRSCGCLKRDTLLNQNHKRWMHGKNGWNSAEYRSWMSMKARCNCPTNPSYDNYGGAGVKVCKRWQGRKGFLNFVADMGKRPKGTTLSRFKDAGDYKPSNCAWHTRVQQRAEQVKKRAKGATV